MLRFYNKMRRKQGAMNIERSYTNDYNAKKCNALHGVNIMGMTSVRMPDELLDQLAQTAEKLRRSKGWVINDAVREYLAREERKAQMLIETREALADIKTGRIVEGTEVMDWLDTWGSDTEKTPPKP